jgi:hypothetical protein
MNESFLHHIWKFKLFNTIELKTTTGEEVQIIKAGEQNTNAGPDFFNARIKIGDTLWAGNVEIHLKSSNWHEHQHHNDSAYNNTILHVSYEHDTEVMNRLGNAIPSIELRKLIDPKIIEQYNGLQKPYKFIPCEKLLAPAKSSHERKTWSLPIFESTWETRLLVGRLERKSNFILDLLKYTHNNWEETLYISLARNFGFHINGDAFEMLAKSLPLSILLKHKNDLKQIEALLFGQAGFLQDDIFNDGYASLLFREYKALKAKFNLSPIHGFLWKFLRLRPSNFPTIRLSQLAHLLYKNKNLFSEIIEATRIEDMKKLFEVSASEFWDTHYTFEKASSERQKEMGINSIEIIIINTIVPFLFVYGQQKNMEEYKEKALKILEQLPPEQNSITENWKQLGVKIDHAYRSQALLQLKNEYCDNKKCLNCMIGNKLLK